MTYAGTAEPDAPTTRTDGVPLAPAGASWPQCATCDGPMRFLAQVLLDDLGQLGGQPARLQNDETPACPTCARERRLVVQLKEGRDHATAMNFGGRGEAYAFACEPHAQAVFLWQC
ncbi:hypothetical protein ACIPLC_27290 [Kitasatospora sp. NPDC086801]|uniref:hypothetical protein n=1 Tax=Kitasatospora sp. NPDC086801 TaxID=3364066 RepID=UPI00380E3B3B